MSKIIKKECVVCSKKESAYKCPSCRCFYCSLKCSKIHKEECVPIVKENNSDDAQGTSILQIELLSDEQKKALSNDTEIQRVIKSTRLQDILIAINSCTTDESRQSLLKKERSKPDFDEFINLLKNSLERSSNKKRKLVDSSTNEELLITEKKATKSEPTEVQEEKANLNTRRS